MNGEPRFGHAENQLGGMDTQLGQPISFCARLAILALAKNIQNFYDDR